MRDAGEKFSIHISVEVKTHLHYPTKSTPPSHGATSQFLQRLEPLVATSSVLNGHRGRTRIVPIARAQKLIYKPQMLTCNSHHRKKQHIATENYQQLQGIFPLRGFPTEAPWPSRVHNTGPQFWPTHFSVDYYSESDKFCDEMLSIFRCTHNLLR